MLIYPASISWLFMQACRNDILNFGRLHLFFPDSRLSLDLNTDKTLKEVKRGGRGAGGEMLHRRAQHLPGMLPKVLLCTLD